VVTTAIFVGFAIYTILQNKADFSEWKSRQESIAVLTARALREVRRAAARASTQMYEVDSVINDMHGATPIYGPHLPYPQNDEEWAPLYSVGMGGTTRPQDFGGRTWRRPQPLREGDTDARREMGGTGISGLKVNDVYPNPQNMWLGDPRHVGQGSLQWAWDSHPEGDIGNALGFDGNHGGGTVPTPNHGTGALTT